MSNLYHIRAEYRDWVNRIIDADGEVTSEQMDEIKRIDGAFEEKAEAYGIILKEQAAFRAAITVEEERLKARKARSQKLSERLERGLLEAMSERDADRLETPRCLISFRKSKAVIIDDETRIPEEYIRERIERTPMKQELAAALKECEVPGCHLEERKNLQIK